MQLESLVAFGQQVKGMSRDNVRSAVLRAQIDDDPNLFPLGGYLVSYGSKKKKDSHGTFFTGKTYYGSHKGDGMDTLIHHGFPLDENDARLVKLADHILSPMRVTEDKGIGLWAETVANMSNEYEKAIKEEVEKKHLKWSSGSAAHMVKISNEGEVLRWPIIEGSMTPTPSEWRGTTEVMPLRSIFLPANAGFKFIKENLRSVYFGDNWFSEIARSGLYRLNDKMNWTMGDILREKNSTPEDKLMNIETLCNEFTTIVVEFCRRVLTSPLSVDETEAAIKSIQSSLRVGKKLSAKTSQALDEATEHIRTAIKGSKAQADSAGERS